MKENINRLAIEKNQQLKESLEQLHILTQKVNHEGMMQVVSEILDRLESPFTFVIVGEVKAGKSSFVNALLSADKEICKVAPSPMTDTIQQILYSETERIEIVNPHLKKIYQNVEILKEISIVDTPGTNTIVNHHQEITERFIPFSDLIVFVFEAKNPYRESAWQFFDYINSDWHKKIIFVLQQKDLLDQQDLDINIKGVIDHAKVKGIHNPEVYAVSAKMEQSGQQAESGFTPLRQYIEKNITGGKAPELKYQNNRNTALKINSTIRESIDLRMNQYEADQAFRMDISKELEEQSARSMNQANLLVENLLASYDRITQDKIDNLKSGLSFFSVMGRSFRSIFYRESSLKDWLNNEAKDLENKLNLALKDKLQNGIIDVAEHIQMMCKMIDAKLKSSETILKKDSDLFADIAEKRANILKELQQSFQDFVQKSENFYDENVNASTSNVGSNLAAGGGLAVVGVILTALTNGAVFDITGGILTAVGVIFAGASLGFKRGKLLKQFKKEIATGRKNLEFEVSEKLRNYIESISSKLEGIFSGLDKHLEKEKMALDELNSLNKEINQRLSN